MVVEIHRFHKIHLFAFAGIARIFPDPSLAIGEVSSSIILAHRRLSDRKGSNRGCISLCPRRYPLSMPNRCGTGGLSNQTILGIKCKEATRIVVR